MRYDEFLNSKRQMESDGGFSPVWMPDFLFDFQRILVDWAIRKGRGAIFADCGLGKTPMQLVWAENVVRKTNGRVLVLLTPFMGVGSEVYGALVNGRKAIGIELKPSYYRQALLNVRAAADGTWRESTKQATLFQDRASEEVPVWEESDAEEAGK